MSWSTLPWRTFTNNDEWIERTALFPLQIFLCRGFQCPCAPMIATRPMRLSGPLIFIVEGTWKYCFYLPGQLIEETSTQTNNKHPMVATFSLVNTFLLRPQMLADELVSTGVFQTNSLMMWDRTRILNTNWTKSWIRMFSILPFRSADGYNCQKYSLSIFVTLAFQTPANFK